MYAGRIVEAGPAERIFSEPLHPYTQGLLGAIPAATHRRGGLVAIDGTVPELIDPPPACRFAGRCPFTAAACETHDPWLVPPSVPEHEVACFLHVDAERLDVAPSEMPRRRLA
jgi:oligopeptide/dipeptide ABC transporter ATP-binding protein